MIGPSPPPGELRFSVDADEPPLAYPDDPWPTPAHAEALAVQVAGPGLRATLVLPMDAARWWAGALYAARSAAYREATGDPPAPSGAELAARPPAEAWRPAP